MATAHQRSTGKRVGFVLAAALAVLGCLQAGADAITKPTLGLTFAHARVSSGTALRVNVTSTHVPAGTKIYVQRQFGTRRVYKNVVQVPAHGSKNIPGVNMGRYTYRLVAVRSGRVIGTSAARTVLSYGTLTALQLCQRSDHTTFSSCSGPNTVQVGSHVFTYVGTNGYGNAGPDGNAAIVAQRSSCRSVRISIAEDNYSASHGDTAIGVALTQDTADQQQLVGAPQVVSTQTFAISSHTWDMTFWTDGSTNYGTYWNATFSCYTSSGDV